MEMVTEGAMRGRVMQTFSKLQGHEPFVPIVTEVEELARELYENRDQFFTCFEQGYLKICKKIKATGCQIPEIFVTAPCTLSEFIHKVNTSKSSDIKFSLETIILFNEMQLKLFSQMISSSHLSIRIFGAKLLFSIFKVLSPKLNHPDYKPQLLEDVIKSILLLIEDRNKNLKKHGLRLSSFIQQVSIPSLSTQIEYLRNQIFGIIMTGDDEETREVAFNNLPFSKQNLQQFIVRLRDKNPKIREIVFQKLSHDQVTIFDLGLPKTYRVLYDGCSLQDREEKQECLNYISLSFGKPNHTNPSQTHSEYHYKQFLEYFQPNNLIQHPTLLKYLDEVIKHVFSYKSTDHKLTKYLKHLCNQFTNSNKCNNQVYFLRLLAESGGSYYKILDDNLPGAAHIAELILHSFHHNQYFQVLELLKLAEFNINSDGVGTQKLSQSLRKIVSYPTSHTLPSVTLPQPTDVCPPKSIQQIARDRYLMNQYQSHPVHSTIDLLSYIVKVWLNIHDMEEVQALLKDIIETLQEQETNYQKQKYVQEISLRKLKESGQTVLASEFQSKLKQIIERQKMVRERYMWLTYYLYAYTKQKSYQTFSTVYDKAREHNIPLSLLIQGAFALNNSDHLQQQYNSLWQSCMEAQPSSLQKLVSMRCITDITIKYSKSKQRSSQLLRFQTFLSTTLTASLFSPNKDLRLSSIQNICRLLYSNTISQPMLYFVYLMILWFDTNSPPKSIHYISVFIKSYIEKEVSNINDISQYLQIFMVTLNRLHASKKEINKEVVSYPMRHTLFMRKILAIALNIIKGKEKVVGRGKGRENNNNSNQEERNPNIYGARESFVICALQEKQLQKHADILFEKSDITKSENIEQLYIIRSIIKENREGYPKGASKVFLDELEKQIRDRNPDVELVESLKNVLGTSRTLLKSYSGEVMRGLVDLGLLEGLEEEVEMEGRAGEEGKGVESILIDDSEEEEDRQKYKLNS